MKKISLLIITIVLLTGILSADDCDKYEEMDMGKRMGKGHKMMDADHHQRGENERGEKFEELMRELDLTEAQKEQLAELRSNHKKEMIQLKSDIEILNVDKKDANKDNKFSEVKKLVKAINAKQEEMKLKKVDYDESRWNILTADQKDTINEMKENHPRIGKGKMKKK